MDLDKIICYRKDQRHVSLEKYSSENISSIRNTNKTYYFSNQRINYLYPPAFCIKKIYLYKCIFADNTK
ncbi:hypothetical protein IW16_07770 [Chryseobacterium vrystaatense]|uniref:Uncharacterized protein n=1 Tax=Chryseobacterium vrystaatense TaxID=307480 RepID=A0ABR4UQ55_9FLAO|nr:hypothetical protein IW16_07770 [Chryseobacterium vrystaatense]